MDNKLFSIKPQKGRLEAGQKKSVILKYLHDIPGIDKLPVLLKIAKGREILVRLNIIS